MIVNLVERTESHAQLGDNFVRPLRRKRLLRRGHFLSEKYYDHDLGYTEHVIKPLFKIHIFYISF